MYSLTLVKEVVEMGLLGVGDHQLLTDHIGVPMLQANPQYS